MGVGVVSDYYGGASLEDWLEEEVFHHRVSPRVVSKFERWREAIESNIDAWLDTDDGDGHQLSWRGWGRGFYAIPEEDIEAFDRLVDECRQQLNIIRHSDD
jgi:hypothetical protein